MDGMVSITEAHSMLLGLLTERGSRLHSAFFGVERYSITDLMLVDVFNAIVAGYQTDQSTKRKIFKTVKTPRELDEYGDPIIKKLITLEERRAKFSHVKKAPPKNLKKEVGDGTIQEEIQ